MDRRRILIEASDGTDASLMGYTHSDLRMEVTGQHFVEAPRAPTQPATERWWQTAWRILNMDILDLWRLYGPTRFRRS